MKKLLSLPPRLAGCFHDITGLPRNEWFCTSDPVGHKLGSGGGTANLLLDAFRSSNAASSVARNGAIGQGFDVWLASEKRILLHAGGQSRRLPAYAPSGKILTPIPVFRWERGQLLSQDLLSLQVPLYEKIMGIAPKGLHTMVVSGDVYIRATHPLQPIPDADVVCYGLWLGPEIAKDHGVFVSSRKDPSRLECMLQKPSVEKLGQLMKDHFYLTDIGVWLLSDKAVRVLMEHCVDAEGEVSDYDMYSTFGGALGTKPVIEDAAVNSLSVAILPLPGGEFYHFGTSHELLSSMCAIQNLVSDQRLIMHLSLKPQPSIFIQNAEVLAKPTEANANVWIENSFVGKGWTYTRDNIITGVPVNDWTIALNPGQCVDIVPIGETQWAVRPYGYYDKFAGELQTTPMFPVVDSVEEMGEVLRSMLGSGNADTNQKSQLSILKSQTLLSAEEISSEANLHRLFAQRREFRKKNWSALASNHAHSVFYQLDLDNAAHEFAKNSILLPKPLEEDEPVMKRVHDAMFRSEVLRLEGKDGGDCDAQAFLLLREGLLSSSSLPAHPRLDVYSDQIVWARCPVRIDIAGGWTDTPPTCLMEGGSVINLAIELNGQPPLQTYVKPCREPEIILRSIDLGASEVVSSYEELADFKHVGSPFSIPKAALALAGFLPDVGGEQYQSLRQQLEDFGCGMEITTLSAIPAGSGLGTSSILAATVLGALNDFCALGWDKMEIGNRTLLLEQLLTTGGGWQDQFGGVLPGVKLLQTQKGFNQTPLVRYLPNDLWTQPEWRQCHLLYYTGITRTAKTILAEIVRRMFLNQHDELYLLRRMKEHTLEMYDAIQQEDFERVGRLVRTTWRQNQTLDAGTSPADVARLTSLVEDFCLGYKLPGAGGGGYLYMVAKDPQAAVRIRRVLNEHRQNANARFVDMTLSGKGLQVSRS